MKEYAIAGETSVSPEDARVITDGLLSYNVSRANDPNYQSLGIFLKDDTGAIAGGLLGETYWGWLHISTPWAAGSLRRMGYGTNLVAAAEAFKRGCRYAQLDTHSFQARPFYECLGYEIFGILEGYPAGYERIFMRKVLSPQQPEEDFS